MSGIYIPGMEMPKSCILCDLSHEDGWCPVKKDYIDRYSFETCPLVPVPEHGRVIDADKIGLTNFEIILCQNGNPFKNALEMLLEKIENAPTLIEAEDGE